MGRVENHAAWFQCIKPLEEALVVAIGHVVVAAAMIMMMMIGRRPAWLPPSRTQTAQPHLVRCWVEEA